MKHDTAISTTAPEVLRCSQLCAAQWVVAEAGADVQGLLPALAPIVPHLAEDAWQALPWDAPCRSVFQAGWLAPPQQWASIPDDQQRAFKALLQIRWRCDDSRKLLVVGGKVP